jgi:hypothetical protein
MCMWGFPVCFCCWRSRPASLGPALYLLIGLSYLGTLFLLRLRQVPRNDRLEAPLLAYGAAILGAMVGGVFDHFYFNLTFIHIAALYWLVMGSGHGRGAHLAGNRVDEEPPVGALRHLPAPSCVLRCGQPVTLPKKYCPDRELLSTQTLPLWASTTARTRNSPSPVPGVCRASRLSTR